jgi:hypothetical protein
MGQRLPRANTQFSKLTNANLGTYGQAVVNGLTASAGNFPTPPVDVATLQSIVNNYNTALTASIGGSLLQRSQMRAQRNLLRNALRQNAIYVNQVAAVLVSEETPYSEVATEIISTGYQLGAQPSPVGPLPEPTIKKFSSPRIGVLYVLVIKVPGARAYILEYGLTGSNRSTWKTQSFANTRINALGLTSGQSYDFDVYARGAATATNASVVNSQVII